MLRKYRDVNLYFYWGWSHLDQNGHSYLLIKNLTNIINFKSVNLRTSSHSQSPSPCKERNQNIKRSIEGVYPKIFNLERSHQ